MSVKSTYNFIPAPEEEAVFKPGWSDQVSQDIPFSDGESGEIHWTLTAETPIFVRNGYAGEEKDPEFCHHEIDGVKQYFIPATSLKGMVRNVLEVMSLSRIRVRDDIFSFRSLDHPEYKKAVAQNRQLKTGWLVEKNGGWRIYSCSHSRIAIDDFKRKIPDFGQLSAPDKYEAFEELKVSIKNKFSEVKKLGRKDKHGNFHQTGTLCRLDPEGFSEGTLVFYGSMDGKKYEYVFHEASEDYYEVSESLMERFQAIDQKLSGTLWQYFKEKGVKRIPVFFAADGASVISFGFSRLYKLSNTHYLRKLKPLCTYYNRKEPYRLDLAETIFGTIKDTDPKKGKYRNTKTLKGRVMFGHALAQQVDLAQLSNTPIVLSSPKASYYPFYLANQETYLNSKATIGGFKRYPVHRSTKPSLLNEENKDIESTINPLPAGTVFKGKIRFHNLRAVEIGALLSALTFHGNADQYFHNIGSAKPLGYGKIKIAVHLPSGMFERNLDDYLAAYEKTMCAWDPQWLSSPYIRILLAMASEPSPEQDKQLVYPQIELELPTDDKNKTTNEFTDYIKASKGLSTYTAGRSVGIIASIVDRLHKQAWEQREALAVIAFNRAQALNTLDDWETFVTEYPESSERPKAEEAILQLRKLQKAEVQVQAQQVPLPDNLERFEAIKKWGQKQYGKKDFTFSNSQKEQLPSLLRRVFAQENKTPKKSSFYRKGQLATFAQYPWKDIVKWLGEKDAFTLYQELTSTKS